MNTNQPSTAFIAASWAALIVGIAAYIFGLFNAQMSLSEKGFYLAILLYALHAAVSIQKIVRDKSEGIFVSKMYESITWASVAIPVALLVIGLWNVELLLSEKGFYGIAFFMSMFAAITVQKNTRDIMEFDKQNPKPIEEQNQMKDLEFDKV